MIHRFIYHFTITRNDKVYNLSFFIPLNIPTPICQTSPYINPIEATGIIG